MDPSQIPAFVNLADILGTSVDTALYVAVGILLASIIFVLLVVRYTFSWKKNDTIALVGLCGAGKTSLFYQLRDGSVHGGTVTSMVPNEGRFVLNSEISKNPKARPVHVIDLPGHPRLSNHVDEVAPSARGIVFVVDAIDFMQQMRANAELLYGILTKKAVVKRRIPILIACNKTDKVSAHAPDFIRRVLEKEIDKLRTTRKAISSADLASEVSLGVEGEPFKFTQCVNRITLVDAAVTAGKLSEIEHFIRELVRP
eukprot:TRINITY_DN6948_c0_g3_i1.p1 TRINITY_DN6948_c0_g3~~TRINITY_DN6948_c0_g3_i1.p1  ORF type:complete len:274 (+),score=30.67 TRINITY_DN6948_c0_g3_i1:56-823(+)